VRTAHALLGLALTVGCVGPKGLETRVDSRRTETYQAEAEKLEGRWQVSFLLPAGEWTVLPEEEQPFLIVPGSPRATLRWTVAPERWTRQDKPFRFRLKGAAGGEMSLSVTYPPTVPGPVRFLLEVLGYSGLAFRG
jgi:hypothetical protein